MKWKGIEIREEGSVDPIHDHTVAAGAFGRGNPGAHPGSFVFMVKNG
jgi:hypothetical protein